MNDWRVQAAYEALVELVRIRRLLIAILVVLLLIAMKH